MNLAQWEHRLDDKECSRQIRRRGRPNVTWDEKYQTWVAIFTGGEKAYSDDRETLEAFLDTAGSGEFSKTTAGDRVDRCAVYVAFAIMAAFAAGATLAAVLTWNL